MSLQWYVLRSKPNKELILWRELLARGFECSFPHLRVRPYFPGYLFVHSDIEQVGHSTFHWMPFSLDPATWGKIPEFYSQFSEAIVTDLSPEQINHLSCLLKEVPSDAIVQDQGKQEWTSAGPQKGSLRWDKTSVINPQGTGLDPVASIRAPERYCFLVLHPQQ